MDLSVIVPVFNEEGNVDLLHARLSSVLSGMSLNEREIIFVNDGSTDGTFEKLMGLKTGDPRVKILNLSRNFGHQVAVTAGLDHSAGDAVVIIDADLQDPPEVIVDLYREYRAGSDVVYAVRGMRKGETYFKLFTARLFYRLLRLLTKYPIPADTGDFRLMSRRVVDALGQMRERQRFVRGMVSWVGFRQTAVKYVREPRHAGGTKYPLRKMIRFSFDAITAFSDVPLRISTWLGFSIAGLSFLSGLIVIYLKLFTDTTIHGWTSILLASFFLGGIQLICLGMIGEYIGRIYEEIKQRPLYFISGRHGFDSDDQGAAAAR